MANEFTVLGTPLASTTNANSYATASQTPTASRGLLAAVLLTRGASTDPVVPTLSGNGLTWTLAADPVDATQGDVLFVGSGTLRYRLFLFEALTGATPSAGALTVSCGGVTHTGCAVIVSQSDAAVDLTNMIAQLKTADVTASSISVTLGAFEDAANYTFSCFAVNEGTTFTHEGTELADVTYSTPVATLMAQFLAGEDTSPGASYADGPDELGAIAVEVRLTAVGGATLTPAMLTHGRTVHALDLDTTLELAALTHARVLQTPQTNPGLAPAALVHARTLFSPTVEGAGALLLPDQLEHTRTLHGPAVSPTALPGLLTHTRALHDPTVGPTLKPAALTHARQIFAPNVVHVVTPETLEHTRTLHAPGLNVTFEVPMLTHARAVYEPAFPGIPGVGASHTHSIHPHRHRDGDEF